MNITSIIDSGVVERDRSINGDNLQRPPVREPDSWRERLCTIERLMDGITEHIGTSRLIIGISRHVQCFVHSVLHEGVTELLTGRWSSSICELPVINLIIHLRILHTQKS